MKFLPWACGAWCLATVAAAAAAEERPVLEYVYPDQSVWTTRLNPRGEPDNPLLRLADVLFAKAGIPWRGRSYPAGRMFDYLRSGGPLFSMLVKAPSLQECCLLSREPVAATELRVYHTAGQPPIRSREDLAGKSVIIIRGYSYAGLAQFLKDPANRIELEEAGSHRAAFAMLERGRADYVLDYAGPAGEVLADHPIADIRHEVMSRLEVHLVLSRSYPGAEAVMAELEKVAASLDRDAILGR